ncbi:TPA: hypothetical protein ACH3X1_002655 [Trebouxia sp. C0004]
MQSHKSTFADSARYFVVLAKALRDAREHEENFHPDFLAHAYYVFDRRWAEMATTVTRLCLFLHPGYRLLSNRPEEIEVLKIEAVDICLGRKWGEEKMTHLFEQMEAYRAKTEDYQRSLTPGAEPAEWWEVAGKGLPKEADGTPAIISVFSRMLLDAVAHAADPERAFSAVGLDHSELRNRFLQNTVGSMALVKKQEEKPRKESSKVHAADAAQLDHTTLQRYQLLNPELPAQLASPDVVVIDAPPEDHLAEVAVEEAAEEQTDEELESSLTAAVERRKHEVLTLPAWWTGEFQKCLDIEVQYDLDASIWHGEYVTVQPEPDIPAFGQQEEAVSMDVDRNELYHRLSCK